MSFSKSSRFYAVLGALSFLVLTSGLQGQESAAPSTGVGGFVPTNLTPGAPAGSYPLSGFEHINYANLHMSIYIPVAPAAGRGEASLPIGFSLDNNITFPVLSVVKTGCTGPSGPCSYVTNYYAGRGWDIPNANHAGMQLYQRSWGDTCESSAQTGALTEGFFNAFSTIVLQKSDGTQIQFLDQSFGGKIINSTVGSVRTEVFQ
jgi:hypothetical protein